jgi:hypothetical protein
MSLRICVCSSALLLSVCAAQALDTDEALDRIDSALTFSASNGQLRARLSGMLDVEAYYFSGTPPGVINTTHDTLLNPRLSLFIDTQLGSSVYAFAQARMDRGFDPSDNGVRLELDEYFVRFTPSTEGQFNLQIGRFATVAGRWVSRHLSWDNPFINAPMPYEQLTMASDLEPPRTVVTNPYYSGTPRYDHLPIVWGPSYATGVMISGALGNWDYAAEVKNSSLSSRPQVWNALETGFDHPTVTGRLGFRPSQMWTFGASASDGTYLRKDAEYLPPGAGFGDYHERVLAQDASFEWHHMQIWAEAFEARFDLPHIGDADTLSYFIEAKYKFTPQLFAAIRWNQQFFGTVTDTTGVRVPWDQDRSRVDTAATYRLTSHSQVKLQYTVEIPHRSDGNADHTLAAQLTLRF